MELVHEFTYEARLDAPLAVGAAPSGVRMVVPVTGGRATGDRISGTFVGPGADWIVVGADGFGTVDVRAQLQTDDGAVIYVAYVGVIEMNDAVNAAVVSGGTTSFDDQYFRTAVRLECGDERYAWVNRTLFVGRGRMIDGGVEYDVLRVP